MDWIIKLWYKNRLSKHTTDKLTYKAYLDYAEMKQEYYLKILQEIER